MATASTPQRFGVRGWVLAASLLLNCGLLAMLFASRGDEPVLAMGDSSGACTMEGDSKEPITGEVASPKMDAAEENLDAADPKSVTTGSEGGAQPGIPVYGSRRAPPAEVADFDNRADLNAADTASPNGPVSSEAPVAVAEVWEDLSGRREKFASTTPREPSTAVELDVIVADDTLAGPVKGEAVAAKESRPAYNVPTAVAVPARPATPAMAGRLGLARDRLLREAGAPRHVGLLRPRWSAVATGIAGTVERQPRRPRHWPRREWRPVRPHPRKHVHRRDRRRGD